MTPEQTASMPARIRKLPVDHRGYPVPWFVQWIDGKPDFRVADASKWSLAVQCGLCWVCGEGMGRHKAFVIGPMCAVNRVSAEPPCHRDCAEWSARACPFLTRPRMRRREAGLPEESCFFGGEAITRNPGVALVWVTPSYRVVSDGTGGVVVRIGEPSNTSWWCEGRPATREEVMASIESGMSHLKSMCSGARDFAELERARERANGLLPSAGGTT